MPVVASGWFFGLRGGILAGLFSLPVNLLLLFLVDRSDFTHFFEHGGGIGTLAIIATGALAGKLGDLQRRLVQNIDERKAVEKELRKLTRAVTQSPISIMITDINGNLEYINPKFTQLTGYSLGEVLGKNPRFLQSGEKSPEEYRQLWQTILSGGEWYGTFHNRKKDGTFYWESATISPVFDEDGIITNFIALKEDITEKKLAAEVLRLSEERFSKAFRSSPVAITITRISDGCFLDVNESFIKISEYTREELVGHSVLELDMLVDDADLDLITQALRGKSDPRNLEVRFRKKNGVILDTLISIEQIQIEEQQCVLGLIYDITERKKRERELEVISNVSAILRNDRPTELISIIQDQLIDFLKMEGVAFVLRNPVLKDLVFELGGGAWKSISGINITFGEGITEKVIETGKPYISKNVLDQSQTSNPNQYAGLSAVACLPIIMNGHNLGAIWVGRKTAIQEDEIRILTSIADMTANAIQRDILYEQTKRHLRQVQTLHSIDLAINASLDLRVTFDIILTQVTTQLGVDAADIFVLNTKTKILSCIASHGFFTNTLNNSHFRLGEGCAGRAAYERRTSYIEISRDQKSDHLRPEIMSEGFASCICTPLIAKGAVMGVLEVFSRTPIQPAPDWLSFLEAIAVQAANAIDNSTLFNNLQKSNSELILAYDATIEGWSKALDLRDKETEGHSKRVTEMTIRLAEAMGIRDDDLVNIRRGALLHDIGKMGIPDKILLKPEPFNEEEWEIMRKHPILAFQLLSPIDYLKPALDIPYCHHEKWDGSGYPRGLKGEEIPLPARIFSVVDNWDALSSDRPYRPAWEQGKILQFIRAQKGLSFDPRVVDEFLEMM